MSYEELQEKVSSLEKELNLLKNKEKDKPISSAQDLVTSDGLRFKKISGTCSGTAHTETAHPHNLKVKPKIVILVETGNGFLYQSKEPDSDNIYVKSGYASLTFDAYVL